MNNGNKLVRFPIALAVRKRGRRCIVGKITYFENSDDPILAVAWRGQNGTKRALSMPVTALEYAKHCGVTYFYLRDDRKMAMWRCPIDVFDRGRLRNDGERYIPLTWLTPCPWRDWLFADAVIVLDGGEGGRAIYARQLSLLPEV